MNKSKAEICKTEISFIGHLIIRDSLKPDPAKVQAIPQLEAPTSVGEVQLLNPNLTGTINYLARFLPQPSTIMEPICQLTRKDVP